MSTQSPSRSRQQVARTGLIGSRHLGVGSPPPAVGRRFVAPRRSACRASSIGLSRLVDRPVAPRRSACGALRDRRRVAADDPASRYKLATGGSAPHRPSTRPAPIQDARPRGGRTRNRAGAVGGHQHEFDITGTQEERIACDCGRLVATTQTKSRPPRRASSTGVAAAAGYGPAARDGGATTACDRLGLGHLLERKREPVTDRLGRRSRRAAVAQGDGHVSASPIARRSGADVVSSHYQRSSAERSVSTRRRPFITFASAAPKL